MTKTKKGISKGVVAAVGAVGAAAAAAYWLYGSANAAKNRKTARSWMLKARAEVLEAVETVVAKAGELDKEKYMEIVQGVLKKYSGVAGVTSAEIARMTEDMKAGWQRMQKARVKIAKKVTKKAGK